MSMSDTPIFRFKFTDDITSAIIQFAKVHQYDDRKTYKETWKEWCEENEEMISREVARLNELGYNGDVYDKMFKAGRYYFRKKDLSQTKKPQSRRVYISMSNDILTAMDTHIKEIFCRDDSDSASTKDNFTPASAYNNFCEMNTNMLLEEIKRIFESKECSLTKQDVTNKIKKTYKNRYFIITHCKNNLEENKKDDKKDDLK